MLLHQRTLDLIMNQVRVQIDLIMTMSEDTACKWQPHQVRVRLVVWTLRSSVIVSVLRMLNSLKQWLTSWEVQFYWKLDYADCKKHTFYVIYRLKPFVQNFELKISQNLTA